MLRVAAFTTERQILSSGRAAVFFGNDVIDLKRQQGNILVAPIEAGPNSGFF
jgi:hypothetical protein